MMLAAMTGAPLRLLRVVGDSGPRESAPTAAATAAIAAADQYLGALAAPLLGAGFAAQTVVAYATPVAAIVVEAIACQPLLIAMTTHGDGEAGHWRLGGTTAAVLASAPVPVLLVGASGAIGAPPRGGAPIVVPFDGSREAEAALPLAATLAAALGGEVVLVRVLPPLDPALADDTAVASLFLADAAADVADARIALARLAARLTARGLVVRREVRVGAAAAAIAAIGAEVGAALIVLATRADAGRQPLPPGGVAEALVREGTVPTVIVRARALPGLAHGRRGKRSVALGARTRTPRTLG
jgi:nucleotide-binding universal stress UspA family protein